MHAPAAWCPNGREPMFRFYQRLLILYPAEFRDEYRRELCLVFTDSVREQRSLAGLLLFWLKAIFGVLTEAPKEHYYMIIQDLQYAIRVMRKDAAVTAAAIAILALGIGSTTLVFSLANGLLLRPLPYADQDRIVAAGEFSPTDPQEANQVNYLNYLDIRPRVRLLEDIGVYAGSALSIRGEGPAQRIPAGMLSDGMFSVLGVTPLMGRVFTRADCQPNAPRVVVIGEDLWRRRYGADPQIIGRSLDI